MIQGVLLAAGASRRFGAPKLQACWQGQPIAALAIDHLIEVLPRVIAVVAAQDSALAVLLRERGASTVVNPAPQRGMGSSIATAVQASVEAEAWVIALADMPWLRPASIAAVVQALRDGAVTAAPRYDGRRGHPVGFAGRLRPQLLQLDGAGGARSLLSDPAQLTVIDVDDPGVILDVDRPGDLQRSSEPT